MFIKRFIGILFILAFFTINSAQADSEDFFGIGIRFIQEPVNKKFMIVEVFPDTPAKHAGIKEGSEIISINNEKVKNTCLCDISNKIRGEENTTVTLVLRYGWRWKKIELRRELIKVTEPKPNQKFETYWKAVAPSDFQTPVVFAKEATDKFSRKYRKTILPLIKYWAERKTKFEQKFNICETYSNGMNEACLMGLLSSESVTTVADKKLYKLLQNEVK